MLTSAPSIFIVLEAPFVGSGLTLSHPPEAWKSTQTVRVIANSGGRARFATSFSGSSTRQDGVAYSMAAGSSPTLRLRPTSHQVPSDPTCGRREQPGKEIGFVNFPRVESPPFVDPESVVESNPDASSPGINPANRSGANRVPVGRARAEIPD